MVQITDNKLVIILDDNHPVDLLQQLQREIIDVVQSFDYINYGNANGCPFHYLLGLLKSTLPTHTEQKQISELAKMINDNATCHTDVANWFEKQRNIKQ